MRRLIVGAALVVAALVGVVLSRTGPDASGTTSTEPVASAPAAAGEAAASGIGVEEARRAAVSAVGSTGEVVAAGMFSRRDVIARFATEQFAPVLGSETTAQVNEFLVALGASGVDPSEVRLVEAPVTARAVPEADGSVTVEVWSVLTVSAPGTSVGRQAWRTVTLTMRPERDHWLVDGWVSRPGPTPALPPEGVIDSRADVDVPLSWPRVAGGDR